jgi:hypothetical protein
MGNFAYNPNKDVQKDQISSLLQLSGINVDMAQVKSGELALYALIYDET